VAETAAVLGSQPYWLWGLEHGVNEHRVAIGNEMVFTREPPGKTGLLGMDLVRLGLERGQSAAAALAIMTELLEAHGQGGSGHAHVDWPYHGSFLIADPGEAWILETSDRRWVARRVLALGNVSNALGIGTDWELGSGDVTEFAVRRGWWPAGAGRVDFVRAYAEQDGLGTHVSGERGRRAAALLAEGRGRLTPAALRTVLRDHYENGPIHRPRPVDHPRYFSLCMHADPLDNTTAAMVAQLPLERTVPAAAWICLGSPCIGAFLPCYLEGEVPERLACGGADPDPGSPWWNARTLLSLVERDFARFAPGVRARFDAFEGELAAEASLIEAEAVVAWNTGRAADGAATLSDFMARSVDRYLTLTAALVREIGSEA
jgi:dipeptidase